MLVKWYPKPQFDKIIEPFAGSARYSLKYFEKDILLVDKYPVVIDIWKWLQQCSEGDVLGLPNLTKGLDLRTLNISEAERSFLGMIAGVASISPRHKVSAFSAEQNGRKGYYKRLAGQLYKIRHWSIICGEYSDIQNKQATWFIDPPYQFGGHAYVHGSKEINFADLRIWSELRFGQTIVCENSKADWMPFKPLVKNHGAMNITNEVIWTNTHTHYNNEQLILL